MQETSYDGQEVLTGKATSEQIQRALSDPRNKSVTIHKPGSLVHLGDEQYVIQYDGSWKRVRAAVPPEARMTLAALLTVGLTLGALAGRGEAQRHRPACFSCCRNGTASNA